MVRAWEIPRGDGLAEKRGRLGWPGGPALEASPTYFLRNSGVVRRDGLEDLWVERLPWAFGKAGAPALPDTPTVRLGRTLRAGGKSTSALRTQVESGTLFRGFVYRSLHHQVKFLSYEVIKEGATV